MEIKDRSALHLGLSDAAAGARYVRQAADQADSAAQYAHQAQGAAQRAENLSAAAAEAAGNYPRISGGFWQVWDAERRAYVSTGVRAQGESGPAGPRGDPGPGPNRNLLANWYFVGGGSQKGDGVFPINQRGQTSYLGANFGIDRWYVTSGASSQVTIDVDGIIYKNTVKTNRFSQHAPISIAGKTVTLSALCTPIDGVRYAVTILTNAGNSSTTFTTEKLTSVTFTVPSTATEINAQIRMENDGASVKIHAIKLELGDTQTLAHQENGEWVLNELPDYGEELAKCQRYFLKIATRGATALGCGYSNGTENIRIGIPLPVTMAASVSSTPTVTVSDLSIIRLVGNGQVKTPLSIAGAYLAGNCITIDFKVSETAENVTYTLKPVAATIYVSI